MKIHAYICSLTVVAAAVTLMSVMTGCETESAATSVHITPSTAQIVQGQSITLTASGGYHYTWSLQNPTWGILSSTEGDSVTYTSLLQYNKTVDTNGVVTIPAPQIQTVQVVSTIPGDSTTPTTTTITPGTTNTTTAASGTAVAQIYHIAN